MESLKFQPLAISDAKGEILCCECGIPIQPNPVNQCLGCIRTKHDISENVTKSASISFCRNCDRYLDPPSSWVKASLESKELLKLCLKRVKGLNEVRLIDAGFVWTEPHSKRIKVKLSIQKEIQAGAVLEQDFVVEFLVQHQLCDECHRVEAKDYWNCVIQVRQKADHKRTFYYLEQLILKHEMHNQALGIKPVHGGLDFFYATEQSALKMVNFLMSVVPCKWIKSQKLKSRDIHNNTCNYKVTYSVEIVPICKDSVVCLPAKLAKQAHRFGSIGQLCIVHRVSNNIFLIDPTTAQIAEVSGSVFWANPFSAICSSKNLTEFTIIDIVDADVRRFQGQGKLSTKHTVKEVWVQKTSELGTGDSIFCRTHLGAFLKHGDSVLGYDLKNSNVNDSNFESISLSEIPDVILVKKKFEEKKKKRKWKLRHLGLNDDTSSQNRDYADFLDDLEDDAQIRSNVNIYRKGDTDNVSEATSEAPIASLDDMFSDLKVHDDDDDDDEEFCDAL